MTRSDRRALTDALLGKVVAEIDAECATQGLTVAELARRARLSKRGAIYTRKVLGDPKLSTLSALYRAVGRRLVITSERLKEHH